MAPKNWRHGPREMSRVAGKIFRYCAGEVSWVATKKANIVLEKIPGWQPKLSLVCSKKFQGVSQIFVSLMQNAERGI
jgi:hypothetical protein